MNIVKIFFTVNIAMVQDVLVKWQQEQTTPIVVWASHLMLKLVVSVICVLIVWLLTNYGCNSWLEKNVWLINNAFTHITSLNVIVFKVKVAVLNYMMSGFVLWSVCVSFMVNVLLLLFRCANARWENNRLSGSWGLDLSQSVHWYIQRFLGSKRWW